MRKSLLTFTLLSLFALSMNAQSAALQQQIAADKNELELEGYTFIDSGDGTTNLGLVLQF